MSQTLLFLRSTSKFSREARLKFIASRENELISGNHGAGKSSMAHRGSHLSEISWEIFSSRNAACTLKALFVHDVECFRFAPLLQPSAIKHVFILLFLFVPVSSNVGTQTGGA